MATRGRKNTISYNLQDYVVTILGEPKVGKTTTIFQICKQLANGNPDTLLSINFGDEEGYSLIDDISFENCHTWKEFTDLVHDLVTHPEENRQYKYIAIETIDNMIDLAETEVLRLSDLESKSGKKSTMNSAFGGWGGGVEKLQELITTQIHLLRNAKYGIFFVGHTSVRTQKDYEGVGAKTVTTNLDPRYYAIFANMSHIIAVFTTERDYSSLSSDDKGKVTGKVESTSRWIYFRDTTLISAGTRISNIPNRVPLSASNFIEAVKEGLKSEAGFSGTEDDFKKKAEEDEKRREDDATMFAQSQLRNEYFDTIKSKYPYASASIQESVKVFIDKSGYDSIQNLVDSGSIEEIESLVNILSPEA